MPRTKKPKTKDLPPQRDDRIATALLYVGDAIRLLAKVSHPEAFDEHGEYIPRSEA